MNGQNWRFNLHRSFRPMLIALIALALLGGTVASASSTQRRRRAPATSRVRRVPIGTQMKIRLNDTINSKEARNGDRFRATVLTPRSYEESTIEGHVARVKQSGKFKGRTSLVLAFDRIRYRNGETAPIRGQLVRVYGEESVSKVDEEGRVESGKRGSQTAKRTGIGAAAGAVIGGLAGGGKGAAIGAAVGAGAGAGSVFIQGSKRLKLEAGTEMLMKVTR
jgi:hypothetical protein